MLTKKDVDLLLEHFVTRTEFNQAVDSLEEKMATKEDIDRVMTTLDTVLKEVVTTRQEQATYYQQHEDMNTDMKNIKKELKSWKTNN